MTTLLSIPIMALALVVVLALITIRSSKPFVSEEWQNQREYERFLRERGKWQAGSLWSVPQT